MSRVSSRQWFVLNVEAIRTQKEGVFTMKPEAWYIVIPIVGTIQCISVLAVHANNKIPNGATMAAYIPGIRRCSGIPMLFFNVYGSSTRNCTITKMPAPMAHATRSDVYMMPKESIEKPYTPR
jgi:hypothetical protein